MASRSRLCTKCRSPEPFTLAADVSQPSQVAMKCGIGGELLSVNGERRKSHAFGMGRGYDTTPRDGRCRAPGSYRRRTCRTESRCAIRSAVERWRGAVQRWEVTAR
jgi:hypothetical protein